MQACHLKKSIFLMCRLYNQKAPISGGAAHKDAVLYKRRLTQSPAKGGRVMGAKILRSAVCLTLAALLLAYLAPKAC